MKSEKKFITEVILRMADFDYGGVLFHARYLEILDYVRNNIFSDINGINGADIFANSIKT